jgi:hypothetical protein
MPDSGKLLAIELKAPKGRVSPHQQQFIDEVNQRGGLCRIQETSVCYG